MILDIHLVAGRNAKWNADLGRWVVGKCWLCWILDPRLRLIRVPDFVIKTPIQAGERNIKVEVMDWFGNEVVQDSWRIIMEMEVKNGD